MKTAINKDLLRMLMEVGFMAVDRGLREKAEALFQIVYAANPEKEHALIGLGYLHIAFGEFEEGEKLLKEEALAINPDSDVTKAYIGLAMRGQNKIKESDEILNEVIKKGKDPHGVSLAETILAELVPHDEVKGLG